MLRCNLSIRRIFICVNVQYQGYVIVNAYHLVDLATIALVHQSIEITTEKSKYIHTHSQTNQPNQFNKVRPRNNLLFYLWFGIHTSFSYISFYLTNHFHCQRAISSSERQYYATSFYLFPRFQCFVFFNRFWLFACDTISSYATENSV